MAGLKDTVFALIANGKPLVRELEKSGAIAFYTPLEGGYEGRYIRRIRAAGYRALRITARGLGDPDAYLTAVHGVRPAHLGKQDIRRYYVPPILKPHLDSLPATSKGVVLWVVEGFMLSRQELEFLAALPQLEPRVKVVVELGGDRALRWQSLKSALAPAA
jgi:NAD(P)H-quinone oxidoreductase subunit N